MALVEEVRQVGWRPETQELLLYVAFPRAFEERRAVFLRDLAERFQVGVVVVAKNTTGELAELVRKHLPVGARLLKPPSLFPDGRVILKLRCSEQVGEGLVESLRRETGLEVSLEKPGEAGEARELIKADGRMELNAAYRRVREALEESGLAVLRCGKKDLPEEHLEVGLLAPWLLEGREELVAQLESETGYPVRPAGANLQALEKKARELLPPAWAVIKPFRWSGREARLALGRFPEEAELASVTRKLREELGIFLRV